MKKLFSLILMVITITILFGTSAYAKNTAPKVNLNSKAMKYDVEPYMKGNEVMLPVRQTVEVFGAKVEYDKKSNVVLIVIDGVRIELPIGKSEFYIYQNTDSKSKKQTVKLSSKIVRSENRTFVPGKKFFESLGYKVTWDSKKKVLDITKKIDVTKDIPYTVITKDDIKTIKNVSSWYDANYKKSGIHFKKHDGVVYVLIAAGKKPTGGYEVGIEKISYKTEKKAYVNAYVQAPSPDMMVTQAETYPNMLIKIFGNSQLTKVEGKLDDKKDNTKSDKITYEEITTDTINNSKKLMDWYNANNERQGISYIKDGKNIYVLIAAGEKSTGGYSISIDELILSSKDTVSIKASVIAPDENAYVIMMISYPSKLIRIKSDSIKKVIGEINDSSNTGKNGMISLDVKKIARMELFDLDMVKIKDINGVQREEIAKAFNEAKISEDFYIFMITGRILKVATTDGYTLTFTSYGSESNVLVSIEKGQESNTFHLVAPVIAKLLLSE